MAINENEIKLNSHGVNANIKAHILSDEKMRRIGFTDCAKDRWYFCKMLDKKNKISFNITIPKDGSDIRIDILDEDYLQPYDYQYLLDKNPDFKFALDIKEKVEKWMKYLQDNSVLSGHKYGEYI